MILHLPSKTRTFEQDVDECLRDYRTSYDIDPKAILVREDMLPGDTYQGVPVIHRNIVAPNYFWLLWSIREDKKEAIWTKK